MFGKHFSTMYTGSMVGSGAITFAVMGYVVSNQKPDRIHGSIVELNPKLLAFILGESEEDVVASINRLCSPDSRSRSKEEEGRRLIPLGQFDYRVVNGAKYRAIRNEEQRRESLRQAQSRFRMKKKFGPQAREILAEKQANESDIADLRRKFSNAVPSVPPSPTQPHYDNPIQ